MTTILRFCSTRTPGFALLCALLVNSALAGQSEPIPGFSTAAGQVEHEIEERLLLLLDPASTARHFRYLTEEPHAPGSKRNRELADYVRDRFVEYGLEDVAIHRYDVLLPLPRKVDLEMLEPRHYRPTLKEDGYPVDKDSYAAEVGPTYMSMSGSGDVTAQVIYAHSGNPEDYDWLESQGIDPRGRIALVRYSMPYSYRGFKAWEAQRRGVKAMIVYSDPMDDGYRATSNAAPSPTTSSCPETPSRRAGRRWTGQRGSPRKQLGRFPTSSPCPSPGAMPSPYSRASGVPSLLTRGRGACRSPITSAPARPSYASR